MIETATQFYARILRYMHFKPTNCKQELTLYSPQFPHDQRITAIGASGSITRTSALQNGLVSDPVFPLVLPLVVLVFSLNTVLPTFPKALRLV